MKKFIIDEVLIENSEKDIKTGVKYCFNSGFNVIFGNNEAGKSSLMKFLKDGLFLQKNTDTGKIYFKILNENCESGYRIDISAKQKGKIYDFNNQLCEADFLSSYINKRYFEQGFIINSDNLNSLQYDKNKSLLNVIKDPSFDELNVYFDMLDKEISKNLGADNRLKKNVKEILARIEKINKEIVQLSKTEPEYNQISAEIENLKNERQRNREIVEYLKSEKEIRVLTYEKRLLKEKVEDLNLEYNAKLYSSVSQYIEILEDKKTYEINLSRIKKHKDTVENLVKKISEEIVKFNSEYNFSFCENNILKMEINTAKIREINELSEKQKEYEIAKNIEENNLANLKDNYSDWSIKFAECKNNPDFDFEKEQNLVDFLEEKIKFLHYSTEEINNNKQLTLFDCGKSIIISLTLILILSVIAFVYSVIKEQPAESFMSFVAAVLGSVLFWEIRNSLSYKNHVKNCEIERENIIKEIKEKLKDESPDIEGTSLPYFLIKADTVLQKKKEIINKYNLICDKVQSLKTEEKSLLDKISLSQEKINNINNDCIENLNRLKCLTEELLAVRVSSHYSKYTKIVNSLNEIKNEIYNKNALLTELNEFERENEEYVCKLKKFLLENNVKIDISDNVEENINNLKVYVQKNNELNREIDKINYDISKKEVQIRELLLQPPSEKDAVNSVADIECLNREYTEIESKLKDLEFRKRELEKVEGLVSLKNEKTGLLNEYRNIAKSILKNKMISEIINNAKKNFEQNQPNVKNAEKYLSLITSGKYTKINVDMEEIENCNSDMIKSWNNLSRGTKEQLYLALRLGYASNYTKDNFTNTPNGKYELPLIIDDAFVNFDLERTKNIFTCLKEFSKTNQIIFFTCHTKEINNIIAETGISQDVNIINI